MQHGGTDGGFSWNTEDLCLQPETLELVIGSQVISSEPSPSTASYDEYGGLVDIQVCYHTHAKDAAAPPSRKGGGRASAGGAGDAQRTTSGRGASTCSAVNCCNNVPDRSRGEEERNCTLKVCKKIGTLSLLLERPRNNAEVAMERVAVRAELGFDQRCRKASRLTVCRARALASPRP